MCYYTLSQQISANNSLRYIEILGDFPENASLISKSEGLERYFACTSGPGGCNRVDEKVLEAC